MTREAPVVLWFRRDLRLGDHAALLEASKHSKHVLALYVLDEALLKPGGAPREAFLYGCLEKLDEQLGGRLMLVRGEPAVEVVRAAKKIGAAAVHVSADTGPYGRRRDASVAKALAEHNIDWVETGSPYAVTPGQVTKPDGDPYRVFTPFHRAWTARGWHSPADTGPSLVDWVEPPRSLKIPRAPRVSATLPEPGERAALDVWHAFLDDGIETYDEDRDRPDRAGTTRLSPYLRWGNIHPRTILADLAGDDRAGAKSLRGEICWREFHADVLWHRPETARENYDKRFDGMRHDDDPEAFERWCAGRTGYPIVDAGMRQLLAEGWMHNRVRMVVASFLVKDLHLPWWLGARHFMKHLVDGDLASNQLNWQWVAGCGTDAAPYFRIFNPTTQGEKFDPNGDYVRKYVPELRPVQGKAVHQLKERPEEYPEPMVDHAHERQVSLERYGKITS
ncbi:deoxyribodipyrimidine photo-lyase [Amycolatopsis sp. SID8362]|uniref:cryptochrome/photolyase family protein n=1 Tax=Amycolatopsis sp. SID8362 TaxID=2690346 RepID=UPI0013702233|nr:deoxyribodipyrimidine photo-lyase [Amycolatopsis sp. SID8362]NBH11244.1 deoxyribodipyrimidine photo-lyase [Amycolatopsis sp. SID8362]NED47936.1 deoxyribodipyrimidine photo-lyase [Amycolatopsis sp. SID8362]